MPLSATLLLCTVLFVQDGDTLRARCQEGTEATGATTLTVRVHAIDAPEHGQPYGRRAREALTALVGRKQVQLRCVDTDPYARHVCQVFVAGPDGTAGSAASDVGLTLIRQGLAWWYRRYADAQSGADKARYESAEDQARHEGQGLWSDSVRAVPPWHWRRTHTQPPRAEDAG